MKKASTVVFVLLLVVSGCSAHSNGSNGPLPNTSGMTRPKASSIAVTFPSMTHMQLPLPGTGLAESHGPFVTAALSTLPQVPAVANVVDYDQSKIDLTAPLRYQPQVIESTLATYSYGSQIAPPTIVSTPAPTPTPASAMSSMRIAKALRQRMNVTPNSSFGVSASWDLGAATNGTYVFQTEQASVFRIFSTSGTLIEQSSYTNIYCGSNPLPICSQNYNPGPGDNRVLYDPGSQRWVMSSLWVCAGCPAAQPVASLAVSKTSDPTGQWYIYQFPNCGSDSNTIGDQPRLGFNSQWIVVTSACNSNDPSLDVFDKSNLYAGGALSLNTNWFQFIDNSNTTNHDNPAKTYVSTINNREYLTFVQQDTSTGKEQIVYSHVEGSVDAPVFYSETDAVDTTVPWSGGGTASVSAPGCTDCMGALTNGTIQSSDVFALSNGHDYILTTNVVTDATYRNANDLIAVAMSDAGTPETLALLPSGSDTGALASEIGMPLNQTIIDTASIVYAYSTPSFYPGAYAAQWNIDYNRLDYNDVLQQGNITPTPCSYPTWCTANRFADFIDAFAPIPSSS